MESNTMLQVPFSLKPSDNSNKTSDDIQEEPAKAIIPEHTDLHAADTARQGLWTSPQEDEEKCANVKDILQDILETLRDSTVAGATGKDTRSRFWAKYKKVAEEHDTEFLERYNGEMDIVLIFSGLFAAVSTSFIVAMESSLSPDPSDTTNALLMQLVQVALGNITTAGSSSAPPIWTGPSQTDIWIQAISYASLSTTLLAAFGAVLGKQWLGYYKSSRYGRGSLEERGKRRQEKMNGITTWYFDAVVQSFPVLLQCSLFLFGVALGANLWFQQQTIASVIIGTTAFGVLFYAFTVLASLISPACPFQTPVSTVARYVGSRFHIDRFLQKVSVFCQNFIWMTYTFGRLLKRKLYINHFLAKVSTPYQSCSQKFSDSWQLANNSFQWIINRLWSYIEKHTRSDSNDIESSATARSGLSVDTYKISLDIEAFPTSSLEAPSVQWLLETCTDPDVCTAAARLVPEIEWPLGLDVSATFLQLRDAFMHCFDIQDRLVHDMQDRAMAYGWALNHLYCESHLVGHKESYLEDKRFNPVAYWTLYRSAVYEFKCLSSRWHHLESLDAKFMLISHIGLGTIEFSQQDDIDRDVLPSDFHGCSENILTWLSHTLPHLISARKVIKNITPAHSAYPGLEALSIAVILDLLKVAPRPPAVQIIANCAVLVGCIMGVTFEPKDMRRIDKSQAIRHLVHHLVHCCPIVLLFPNSYRWRSAEELSRADQCLLIVSRILEVAPPMIRLDDEPSPSVLLKLDWAVELCKEYFKSVPTLSINAHHHSPLMYARAALRIAVTAAGGGKYQPDAPEVIWCGSFSGSYLASADADDSLVDYMVYLWNMLPQDSTALGDALLVLSAMDGFGSPSKRAPYLKAMIFCMGASQPRRLRHVALRAASRARLAFIATENIDEPEVREIIFKGFSPALLTAVCPSLGNEEPLYGDHTSDRSHDMKDRDYCYMQLIFTLAKNSDWVYFLLNDGHIKRCINLSHPLLGQRSWLDFYLGGILARIDSRGKTSDIVNKPRLWRIFIAFWDSLSNCGLEDDHDCIEVIPAAVGLTLDCFSNGPYGMRIRDIETVRDAVDLFLGKQKQCGKSPEATLALEKLKMSLNSEFHPWA